MENRLFIHAYNKGENINFYKGYYNGTEFVPKIGSCKSIDELLQLDYVQFYGDDGLTLHIGHKMHKKNLEDKMKREYIKTFGDVEQTKLF
ncbi:hypothetical protein [Virgibacillus sp. YIM 98842]|uniref:hypothetical protein n=1 Tax=Virgibacillus sp. YIM 98842 TaxID=2663533 RepID=UPI0013DD218C|nr:hypothetical protein [Virgibacillus sp. YIM 98842]